MGRHAARRDTWCPLSWPAPGDFRVGGGKYGDHDVLGRVQRCGPIGVRRIDFPALAPGRCRSRHASLLMEEGGSAKVVRTARAGRPSAAPRVVVRVATGPSLPGWVAGLSRWAGRAVSAPDGAHDQGGADDSLSGLRVASHPAREVHLHGPGSCAIPVASPDTVPDGDGLPGEQVASDGGRHTRGARGNGGTSSRQ